MLFLKISDGHSKLHGRDIQVNIAKPPTSSNNRRNNNRDNGERRGDVRDHGERGGNVPEIDGSKTMEDCSLFQSCFDKDWPEVRKYLSSDAAEEEKKSHIMYRNRYGWTCLHQAYYRRAPVNIIEAMLNIGGKELVMMKGNDNYTVLHTACCRGASSYNIIKMLIDVGGNDLVMAKNKYGNTALHCLCIAIKRHTKAAEKIKLILQVGDANLLLSAKNRVGKTPLEIATDKGASNIIKELLTLQSNFNSTRSSNNPSTNIVPEDNSTPVTQSNQDQDTTRSSSIRGLDVEVGRMKRKHQ
jgi:ankyrin repeat protein